MARLSLATYRKQWPRIGGVLAMAVGGFTVLGSRTMSRPLLLSTANFGALLVHQYEEYVDPGWFPGQFNKGMFHSDTPRHYPLNANTGMCINTAIAYPFYIAPIVFPRSKWLGLGPVIFGMTQAVGHGVLFPRIAGDKYSPGFLASILLHVPIGITYIGAMRTEGLSRNDILKGLAYTVAFSAAGVAAPNFLMRDKNSTHEFETKQMGRYGTTAADLPS